MWNKYLRALYLFHIRSGRAQIPQKLVKNSGFFRPPTTSRSVALYASRLLNFCCKYYTAFFEKKQAFEFAIIKLFCENYHGDEIDRRRL